MHMAKARLTTKSGTKIVVEGNPVEVAALVRQIEGEEKSTEAAHRRRKPKAKEPRPPKATPVNLVSTLIDGGFFRKPKDLAAVKVALEEMGHYFPVTTLSPTLLRLVRRRQLRRLRDKKGKSWLYTG